MVIKIIIVMSMNLTVIVFISVYCQALYKHLGCACMFFVYVRVVCYLFSCVTYYYPVALINTTSTNLLVVCTILIVSMDGFVIQDLENY